MNIAAKPPEPHDDIAAFRREIPDHKDVFEGELARSGDWIVANIATDSFWPITTQKVRWRGVDIWILPIMKNAWGQWQTGPWFLRAERAYLFPGDSAMGYRLPIDSQPWAAKSDYPYVNPPDPASPMAPLRTRARSCWVSSV